MKMSSLFSQTLREAPKDADVASHQLLVRAGYIRQLAAGSFSYLPLAHRSMRKICDIIRAEMDAIGGQEITMPVVHPADLWKETGRWYQIGSELTRFHDRGGRDMVLAMTHEEVITDLVRDEISSYKQLPVLLYQIQTKWRDEPRSRAGLIRVREFTMKDSYSLDVDEDGLDVQYRAHYQAYFNIYRRCGIDVIAVASDTGMMGGKLAHEFMYLTPIGEDRLLVCEATGYSANREVAVFKKPVAEAESPLPLERIATPDTSTIEALAQLLNVPKARTAKAVFMMATLLTDEGDVDKLVFAIVRGDMDLNEIKLANAVKAKAMRPATPEEIEAVGAVAGYASPVGIAPDTVLIVVDDAILTSPNLVAGANEVGYHLKNVNYGRDYEAHIITDIAAAREGDTTIDGEGTLSEVRGIEVGNIFKLGTRYTTAMGATFLDANGKAQPVIMGSYGIGVGRLLACIAEAHHDDNGLIMPITVAPYEVHLVLLPGDEGQPVADALYADLRSHGIDTLYDDRDERPGVKFNDADLIGVPLRLTVSRRSLEQGGVEFKDRATGETRILSVEDVVGTMQTTIAAMKAKIAATVLEEVYRA